MKFPIHNIAPGETPLESAIATLAPTADETLLLFVAEKDAPALQRLVDYCNRQNYRIVGARFPAVFHDATVHERGALLYKVRLAAPPCVLTHVSAGRAPVLPLPPRARVEPGDALLLMDGLADNLDQLLEGLFYQLGHRVSYFGGGAGSLSLEQQPCLFTNEGVFQDAAVLCFLQQRISMGMGHGWQQLAGPLIATRTSGTLIHELNWQPAYEVYRQLLQPYLSEAMPPLTAENFFAVAKNFPFGMAQAEHEPIVRDPIAVAEGGGLLCVGEVPENSILNVLYGSPASMQAAAAAAASAALAQLPPAARPEWGCVALCISRQLYWGGDFAQELEQLAASLDRDSRWQATGRRPQGFLCLGEVYANGNSLPNFLNKSLVSALFYDAPAAADAAAPATTQ